MSNLLEIRRPEDVHRASVQARMPQFVGCAVDAASALADLRVLIAGVGSVGRNVAEHLARLHVRELLLSDPAKHKDESLLTHPIRSDEIGQSKALGTANACKDIAPETRVRAFEGPLQDLDLGLFAECDVVVLASDNLLAEREAGWRCSALSRPLVHASVHGDTLTAQVRFFANGSAEDPCPLCAFGAEEWRHLDLRTRFRCDGAGELEHVERASDPTISVSFLCSLAADLAATQVVRHALGLGEPIANTVLEANGYTHRTRVSELNRNPNCRAVHAPWERAVAPRPLRACSLHELAAAAAADVEHASFVVSGLSFCARSVCQCGQRRRYRRFLRIPAVLAKCPACGGPVDAAPFDTYRQVSSATLRSDLGRPLGDLSDESVDWVVVHGRERATMFRSPGTPGERSAR